MNIDLEAYRYAKAIASVTQGDREPLILALGRVCEQLESGEIARFLAHPLVSTDHKAAALDQMLGSSAPAKVREILGLAVRQGMGRHLRRITEQLRKLNDDAERVCRVEIVSAQTLDNQQTARLQGAIARAFDCRVVPTVRVDPGLIAGVRVRVDDLVIDSTVKMQLEKIGSALAGASEG